jgi:hypothetical protein
VAIGQYHDQVGLSSQMTGTQDSASAMGLYLPAIYPMNSTLGPETTGYFPRVEVKAFRFANKHIGKILGKRKGRA